VVLGHPEAVIAQRLAVLRERDGVADGVAVRPVDDRNRLIEYREAQGADSLIAHDVGRRGPRGARDRAA
jgi:hypothetical protein